MNATQDGWFPGLSAWRAARAAFILLAGPAAAGALLAGCGGEASDVTTLGTSSRTLTSETGRILRLLQAGSDGQPGFLLKRVGGPVLESFNQTLVYDPASSIKIVVAVSLLQQMDEDADLDLGTTVAHLPGLDGSCPTGSGAVQHETLGNLLPAGSTRGSRMAR